MSLPAGIKDVSIFCSFLDLTLICQCMKICMERLHMCQAQKRHFECSAEGHVSNSECDDVPCEPFGRLALSGATRLKSTL